MAKHYPIKGSGRNRGEEGQDASNPERDERSRDERNLNPASGADVQWPRMHFFDRNKEGRGFIERAGDELRSYFGDQDAERRRRRDERNFWRSAREGGSESSQYHLSDARACDVMTRGVVTVFPWETVERAAHLMDGCDCGVLPVVDFDRRLIGILTDRDIALRAVGRGLDPRQTRIGECMSEEVYVCHVDDSVKSCMSLMARQQIRRLPILDDQGHVVGIISQGDL